jgi:hypothetical protein
VSAVDDLVERAVDAERAALASRWKDRRDVESLVRSVRRAIDEQHDPERRSGTPASTVQHSQPSTMPPESDGAGSGRRTMRNALISPMRPARNGTARATWSARGLASVLILMIS